MQLMRLKAIEQAAQMAERETATARDLARQYGAPLHVVDNMRGQVYNGDCMHFMDWLDDGSVDLIITSPPYALVTKKKYGNTDQDEYTKWFLPFAREFRRVLKDTGSLVLNTGGAWNKGSPTRSLYQQRLLIALVDDVGFHLAQDFYWWKPNAMPAPAQWVTVEKIRNKDSVEQIWVLSKTERPKMTNQRNLVPYSKSQTSKMEGGGFNSGKRPSGHDVSGNFVTGKGGAIASNIIACPNTESNSHYFRACKEAGIKPHPARFPSDIPEYFIRMLTDEKDIVLDPFAGSLTVGEVASRLNRTWVCCETEEEYVRGGLLRFEDVPPANKRPGYTVPSPMW